MKLLNEVNPPIEECLEHFGVRGMKWGVRKGPLVKGRLRAATVQALRDKNLRKQRRQTQGALRFVPGRNALSRFNQKNVAATQRRVANGQTKVRDILRILRANPELDLIVQDQTKPKFFKRPDKVAAQNIRNKPKNDKAAARVETKAKNQAEKAAAETKSRSTK